MVTKIQNNVGSEKVSSVTGNLVGTAKRGTSAPAAVADAVVGGGTARLNMVAEASLAVGENPFATVAASAQPSDMKTLRLADSADATSESIEPSLELMSLVSGLEAKLTTRGVWSAERLRTGMMQTTYDAQEERIVRTGVDRDGTETLAKYLMDRPVSSGSKPVIHANEWQAQAGTYFKGGDVNAFVQSVLRESYVLGNGELQMFADRVKSLNELRKKIRDEVKRAREYKNQMAEEAAGREDWEASFYYEPMTINDSQDALVADRFTQKEIDDLKGTQQGDVIAKASAAEAGGVAAPARDFWNDSWLSGAEGSAMGNYAGVKVDKLRNDKKIMAQITAAIPHMSANDITKYLLPILKNFKDHGHEGGILDLVRAMSPEQRLVVAAAGFGSDSSAFWDGGVGNTGKPVDQFSVSERAEYNSLLEEAVTQLAPNDKTDLGSGVTTAQAKQALDHYKANIEQAKAEQASAPAPENGLTAETVTGTDTPHLGGTKRIDTVVGMEDYIKTLEDMMNSVGDDAQLANVDLQNCLQKQQQTMQMMSNISKMLHDVAMSIIRNMNS